MLLRPRGSDTQADWTDVNQGDPGVVLLELWSYVADLLGEYADTIAAESQLRTRRRYALALGTVALAVFVWWQRASRTNDDEPAVTRRCSG